MNMFKNNGGFTLVELIVVIAILAILAAVAVPAYSGYITEANDSAVETELTAISTAVMAANATAGQVTGIEVSPDGKTVTITGATAAKFADDFKAYYGVAAAQDATTKTTYTVTITPTNAWTGSSYNTKGAVWTPTSNGWNVKTSG